MAVKRYKVIQRLLILFFLAYFLFFGLRTYFQIRALEAQTAALEVQKQVLTAEKQALEKEKELLQDKSYLETLARQELGYLKPGEKILIPAKPGEPRKLKPPKEEIRD